MSRNAKWKLEKTKVKVVFRLQFFATHIPQTGWEKLFISFIPTESGKTSAKTTKANVRNGTCKWGDPIYETTRLLQDAKSKQYDEKLYKIVVAMGSSRSSVLGETTINLADYVDALKPSAVALPLHGCNSGTIIHVTVQLLTSKTGFREFEQQRELRERGLQMGTDLNRHDVSGKSQVSSPEDSANDQMDKVNTRISFRPEYKELPSLEEVGLNKEYADTAVGFDGSSSTPESLYVEKHDTSSTHEVDSLKSTVSGELNELSHCQTLRIEKGYPSNHRNLAQGSNDWVQGWGSDYSMNNDLTIAYEENSRCKRSMQVAESSILELKLEVSSLQSCTDEIGVETQKFAYQLAAEIASSEELAKEVLMLRSECSKFKDELERLQNLKESNHNEKDHLLRDKQLRWLKGILIVEDMIRELQNKAYLSFHERDFSFLHTDLEALLSTVLDLKQGTGEAVSPVSIISSERANVKEIRDISLRRSEQYASVTGFDVDLYQPENMLHYVTIPSLVSQELESTGATLDEAKVDRESLARKMDQMECYYEALIQELEENQKQMLGELQNLKNEHSTCLYTISTSKAEMELMHQNMNEQIIRFAEERRELDSINKELERRAITSEAALKRARLNYSIAGDKLQKDLQLLSSQVLSMFETNENIIKQTFSETSHPCFHGYPDVVQNLEKYDVKFSRCLNENVGVKKQLLGGDFLLEDLKKSLCLQEDLYQKVEEELCEMHLTNLYLDVFSKTLQETLLEANIDIEQMKEKIDEFVQKLELSTVSKDLLMVRLQTAMDEVHTLNEYNASCIAKCRDMLLQNQILEAKLESFSEEKCLLMQKITECKALMMEYRSYESKYEACSAEKLELEHLYQKVEEELCDMHLANLYLDVFSKTLQETLLEANIDIEQIKEKMVEFVQKLELSTVSKDLLMVRLQTAMDEVRTLNEYKASCIAKCRDMLLQNQILEAKLESISEDKCFLVQKITECEALMMEYRGYESKYEACSAEKLELENSLKLETLKNGNLQNEMYSLKEELKSFKAGFDDLAVTKENLQKIINFLQDKLGSLLASYDKQVCRPSLLREFQCQNLELNDFEGFIVQLEEIQHGAWKKILQLMEEKKALEDDRNMADVSLSTARSEILGMKQKFMHEIQHMVAKLDVSNALVEKLQLELESVANKFHISLEEEEKCAQQNKELFTDFTLFEVELQKLTSKNRELAQEILGLDTIAEELGRSKLTIAELILEKQDLTMSLQDKTEECAKLASEVDSLKVSLRSLHDELHVERGFRDKLEGTVTDFTMSLQDKTEESAKLASEVDSLKESLRSLHDELLVERGFRDNLEGTVTDLTSQLNEKNDKLLHIDRQNDELVHFKQLASDLELEKSRGFHLLLQHEECLEKLQKESSCLAGLKSQLSEMHEYLIAADVKLTFVGTQYETRVKELVHQLQSSDGNHRELQKKHLSVEALLNRCLANEEHYMEENSKLVTTLESLRSELEASVAHNRIFSDSDIVVKAQLEEYKKRLVTLEVIVSEDNNWHALEVEQLKNMMENDEGEIANLIFSMEELEIRVIVLQAKLDEQHARLTLLEDYNDEQMMLRNQCNELTHRLSEQILKTDEYKNLSIHLKELKDKADAECLLAREKREPERPSFAQQESLRIAFVKEQYETRLQELRQQLSISKKHREEMLWKLQDVIDDTENRKKSEAFHLKRNEELSLKILEMEAELQLVLSDKREKIKGYDRAKAELECALLSLECCKEEKEKLEASLQKCKEEKSNIAVELVLRKGQLENATFPTNIQKEENGGLDKVRHISSVFTSREAYQEDPMAGTASLERTTTDVSGSVSIGNPFPEYLDQNNVMDSEQVLDASSIPIGEGEHSTVPMNEPSIQSATEHIAVLLSHFQHCSSELGVIVSKGLYGIPERALLDHGDMPLGNSKHLAIINDHFRAQSLKSSLEHLHEELERMKNENSPLPQTNFDPYFQDLQRELLQLQKVNQELGSMFPLFDEFSGSGNALERVLALEIELAEALRAKKNSSTHFQSSFLKQHSDEEAVFKSFRDINELIKDMLELKGRYATVETELKEMHNRYSQLSLQFAEVEGERQKLMMTLKNVRASKKLVHLSRSSSATLGDHPS